MKLDLTNSSVVAAELAKLCRKLLLQQGNLGYLCGYGEEYELLLAYDKLSKKNEQ